MPISERLDLEIAWKRYKKDLVEQAFSDHPYEVDLIEENLVEWLESLSLQISSYTPFRAEVINVDKPDYHLRPGTRLATEDGVMYQALLLAGIDKIGQRLKWSASKQRFAHILADDQSGSHWCMNDFGGWDNFRKASLHHLASGFSHVVFADVSAYFENISLSRLSDDLRLCEIDEEVLKVLRTCLDCWAQPRSRGIPQGYRPSFILGELYFNSIDRRLLNDGYVFCRYVDDIRIFCKSKEEAISALHHLTILLREKELNLQTAKSFISTAEDAHKEIEGVVPVITQLEGALGAELEKIVGATVDYPTPALIQSVLEEHGESIKLESLRILFREHFMESDSNFDKSLFHYCLNRLGAARDDYASEKCLSLVVKQPQELKYILGYFAKLTPIHKDLIDQLCSRFSRTQFISDHQIYLLLRHIWHCKIDSSGSLFFARRQLVRTELDDYTRDYARAVIGAFGEDSDLDALEAEYAQTTRIASRAAILCSITRMIKSRRNTIYKRAYGEANLIDYAIRRGKQG